MHGKAEFLPGLELSRIFYAEVVRPLIEARFAGLSYSAALMGAGSEVQGFDTATSTDHGWGPRLQLFLHAADERRYGEALREELSLQLPTTVRGWSTHFQRTSPDDSWMLAPADGPIAHRVEVVDYASWSARLLGIDPTGRLTARDWLCIPQQYLAELTGGTVFHDGLGTLNPMRNRLAWYPPQVWRYLLSCQWMKLSQEEAFVGRCAEVGDDLGSAVVTARQAREVMRLALLMERRYAPYSKWLGTAFARDVPGSNELGAMLRSALAATSHTQREQRLCDAYENLARRHNTLGLTIELDPGRRRFHERQFQVLRAERFAHALHDTIVHPDLKRLPLTGSVDQWADNTDYIAQADAIAATVQAL